MATWGDLAASGGGGGDTSSAPAAGGSTWGALAAPPPAPTAKKSGGGGGFFGIHLPKLGLNELLPMAGATLSGIWNMGTGLLPGGRAAGELPSAFGKGALAGTLGTFGRIGDKSLNALTLGEFDKLLPNDVGASVGGWLGSSPEQEAQLSEAAHGYYKKGLIPGLIGDVGNVALVGQGLGKLASLGEVGTAAEAATTATRAAEAGFPAEGAGSVASRAAQFSEASPLQRFASRIPVANRLIPGAGDLAGGSKVLNAAGRAAAKAGELGDTIEPAALARRAQLLDTLHSMGHPYSSVFQNFVRPLTKAGAAATIETAANVADNAQFGEGHPHTVDEQGVGRPMTPEDHAALTQEGEAKLAEITKNSSPPVGLDQNWPAVKAAAVQAIETGHPTSPGEWGGITIDAHTGADVGPVLEGADKYSVSVRNPGQESISIPAGSSAEEIGKAMDFARDEFAPQLSAEGGHLGVFHDANKGTIDIDPIQIAHSAREAEALGLAGGRSEGAAYHFGTGNGLYPPHVAEGEELAKLIEQSKHESTAPLEKAARSGADNAPAAGPAEAMAVSQLNKPVPEWASKLSAKLPEGVNRRLNKAEGVITAHQISQAARERVRFIEVAKNQVLRSDAMTFSTQAAKYLLDQGVVKTAMAANRMVARHLEAALDTRAMIVNAVTNGFQEGDAFVRKIEEVASLGDPISREMIANHPQLSYLLSEATNQWRDLAKERYTTLVGTRVGSKGLDLADATEPVMSAKQVKEYNQIKREFAKAERMQGAVAKEADAAAAELMAKNDKLAQLGAKVDDLNEQKTAAGKRVFDQVAPRSLMDATRPQTIARMVAEHDTGSGMVYASATDKIIVPAKFATEADRLDPTKEVFAAGPPGGAPRYVVGGIASQVVPLDTWAATGPVILDDFIRGHITALANPDVLVRTWTDDAANVHIELAQHSIDGRPMLEGQSKILGTARGVPSVLDMNGNDFHPPVDSISQNIAAHHVLDVMRPNSQLNRFIKERETAAFKIEAAALKDGVDPRLTVRDMTDNLDVWTRLASSLPGGKTLEQFYKQLGTEFRVNADKLPVKSLLQTNLNLRATPKVWAQVEKYLGPDTDKALTWYNRNHDIIEGQFRGRSIDLWDERAGAVKSVDMADLMYSLLAVTSVNASPMSNISTALRGLGSLVDYQQMQSWVDHFRSKLESYDRDVAQARAKVGASGRPGPIEVGKGFNNELFNALVGGEKLPHTGEVRVDVMPVLGGRLLDEWDNEFVQQRTARTFQDQGSERATMEHYGSNGYAKIRSFHENLKSPETSHGVTLDRVMAEFFGIPGGSWTSAIYAEKANEIRTLADQLTQSTGKTIMPHQVQAALWVFTKQLTQEIDRGQVLAAVKDDLASIKDGSFTPDTSAVRAYYQDQIDFGTATNAAAKVKDASGKKPSLVAPRKVKTVPGDQSMRDLKSLAKSKIKEVGTFEQHTNADIVAYQRQMEKWLESAKEVEAQVKAGRPEIAAKQLLTWGRENERRFNKPAEDFDAFGLGDKPGGLHTPALQAALDKLRQHGILGPAEGAPDVLFQKYEADHAAELHGLAAGADAEHGAAADTLKDLAAQPHPQPDTAFQKFGDSSVLGATYTSTKTGRLTMAFFKSADPTTLVHEGAHVLRQLLPEEDITRLERSLGAKVGTVKFEEAFAEHATDFFADSRAPIAIRPVMQRVQDALRTIWDGIRGRDMDHIDPVVAEVLDRYLNPQNLAEAPQLPSMELDLRGKTAAQIASHLPVRPGETPAQSLRRGYLAGRDATRVSWIEERQKQTVANMALVNKAKADLLTIINNNELPKAQLMERTTLKAAARADKLATELDRSTPISRLPPAWQPAMQALRDLQKAAVSDPVIAAAMAQMPQTFSELVDWVKSRGGDPTHIGSLSEAQVRQLVNMPLGLWKRAQSAGSEVEAGTRQIRSRAYSQTHTLESLAAAQVQVVWEREVNHMVDLIETNVARPYVANTPGWVPWDDQRGFLLTGEHTARPEPKLMVPESVARSIKHMSKNYSHPVFSFVNGKVTHAWKAYVMQMNPGHYVNVGLGQFVMSELQGVHLKDYAQALVGLNTGEYHPFGKAAAWLERHGKGSLPESVDINELRGVGAQSEYGEAIGSYENMAHRPFGSQLIPGPRPAGPIRAFKEAEGVAQSTGAAMGASKEAVLRAGDRANNFVAAMHRLGRAATYLAGRRQGLSDEMAMMRSYEALVDYGNLSPFERSIMTTVFPFYSFQKGLLKIVARFPVDHPVRAALAIQLAGLNETLINPGIPEYYQALLHIPGTNRDISGKPINPFQDGLGLATPEGIGAALNPAIKAVVANALSSQMNVYNQHVNQFGQITPDTSPAEDLASILRSGGEGSLLGSVAGVGGGGTDRGVLAGTAAFAGAKTYDAAYIEKLRQRLAKNRMRTSSSMYPYWEVEQGVNKKGLEAQYGVNQPTG